MDEVSEGLVVGTEADASDQSQLRAYGIDTVVSLTHSDPDTGAVTRIDVPMVDGPQNSYQAFAAAVQTVVTRRTNGERVLVHCAAGSSRSPAVAAAAITHLTAHTLTQSFNRIIEQRPETDPHDALVRQAVAVTEQGFD